MHSTISFSAKIIKKLMSFSLLSLMVMANHAYAMQCPKVAPPAITFLHQVVPGAQAQPWQMDTTFISEGWSIVSNPPTENSKVNTLSASAPLTVIFTKNNTTATPFLVVCQYQIESGPNPILLTLTNSRVFAAPINSNFKKINDTSYMCTTDASHPESCNDADVHPVVCGLGQSC